LNKIFAKIYDLKLMQFELVLISLSFTSGNRKRYPKFCSRFLGLNYPWLLF